MKIRKSSAGGEIYIVESSTPGSYYKVNAEKKTCNCPHFVFRLRQKGEYCKHILEVCKILHNKSKDDFEKAVDYIKKKGRADSVDVIEEYGEGLVQELIDCGHVIENKGMLIAVK